MFVGVGPKNTPLENDLPLWVHVSHWFHCQSCAKQVSTRRFVQLHSFHCLWIISMEYHGCANASWIDDKTLIVDKKNRAFQGNENRMRHLSREWSSLYFAPWRMNFWAFQLQYTVGICRISRPHWTTSWFKGHSSFTPFLGPKFCGRAITTKLCWWILTVHLRSTVAK